MHYFFATTNDFSASSTEEQLFISRSYESLRELQCRQESFNRKYITTEHCLIAFALASQLLFNNEHLSVL